MMKRIIYIVTISILLLGCTKEVGKKPYELDFTFNSGEKITFECLIYEKEKHYEAADGNDIWKNESTFLLLKTTSKIPDNFKLELIKTKAKFLITINEIYSWPIENATFANNQNVLISGVIELNGEYKKQGRKYEVQNGSFIINWGNAPDYGEPIKYLQGTWTLKRK